MNRSLFVPRLVSAIVLTGTLSAALLLVWIVRTTPLDPAWSPGLVRVDGLAALWIALSAAFALAELAEDFNWRRLFGVSLLGFAYLTTHFALLGALLALAAILAGRHWPARLSGLCGAAGLALIGIQAGAWRYPSPTIGLGLNSVSLLLLIGAVLLVIWWPQRYARNEQSAPFTPQPDNLLSVALLYGLLRLFVLGPWNLGWLFALQLLGAAGALWAAWHAAHSPHSAGHPWLSVYLLSLSLAGIGLSSGAGIGLVVFALLALLVLQLSCSGSPGRLPALIWPQSAAVPFSLPFTAAWAAVAGALAGGLSLLAGAFWFAAMLAALPPARFASAAATDEHSPALTRWIAAGLSILGGIAAPAISSLLIEPIITQLQAGLTPFGDLALWPWAGLISQNSARQTVATLPSLALAVLMIVLAALVWLLTRLFRLGNERPPDA